MPLDLFFRADGNHATDVASLRLLLHSGTRLETLTHVGGYRRNAWVVIAEICILYLFLLRVVHLILIYPVHLKLLQGVHLIRCYHLIFQEMPIVRRHQPSFSHCIFTKDCCNSSACISGDMAGRRCSTRRVKPTFIPSIEKPFSFV